MAEDHGAPEAGQLPRARARARGRRKIVTKERAVQRVRSWTVQNEMRGVLGRVSAPTAKRILDSTIPREIRAKQKAVSVTAKTRENTASVTREHKFLSGNRGNLCVKEF